MTQPLERVAPRVFASVLAPLVLGGPMRPSHPIGARTALLFLDTDVRASDADLSSRVDRARAKVARKLVPIDRAPEPGRAEWALAAALHDLLQAASPHWIRRSSARRLLDLAALVLDRVPRAKTARDALGRHTWFARSLEIARTDTRVSWWSGTREFFGEEPPARLLAWRDVRRVHVLRSERAITELVANGGVPEDQVAFVQALAGLLRATPLTDFATLDRGAPMFAWSEETLGLARSPAGCTLALRAAARLPVDAVDVSLGRATRELLASRAWAATTVALDFLAHRAIAAAQSAAVTSIARDSDPASFARAAGALVARKWLDDPAVGITDRERRRLAPILDAAIRSDAAREIARMI